MSYPQQQLIGFSSQVNPNISRQMMSEQRMQQQQQSFEQMQHQQSFGQLQQQKYERSQQQQQHQQQSMYQTPRRGGGYNLNQSAILFGNTTSTSMNTQMMQGNWHMQNQQMDQLNHSFNLMNLGTSREVTTTVITPCRYTNC